MLRIRKEWTKATCVADLSYLEGKISSSIYTERYPKVGTTYNIESIYLINEQRNGDGRCVPRRHDTWSEVLVTHLVDWNSEQDDFGFYNGFPFNAFIYDKTSDQIYEDLLKKGLNIRIPGFEEKLALAISEKRLRLDYWFIKKTEKEKKQYNSSWKAIKSVASSEFGRSQARNVEKIWRADCLPGGYYYDKPYHGLRVVNELVVENESHLPKKPSIDTKQQSTKIPEIEIDFELEF